MDNFPCAQTLGSALQLAKAEIDATRCLGMKRTEQIHLGKAMTWGFFPGPIDDPRPNFRKQSISIKFDQPKSRLTYALENIAALCFYVLF
jgi:hypothetical protein